MIQVNKSGSEVVATISFDSSVIDERVSGQISVLESQRASGLSDSESLNEDGEKVSVPKTQRQIADINTHYDILVAAEERRGRIMVLEAIKAEIEEAIVAEAFSDSSDARVAEKAAIDAKYDRIESKRPAMEVEFSRTKA